VVTAKIVRGNEPRKRFSHKSPFAAVSSQPFVMNTSASSNATILAQHREAFAAQEGFMAIFFVLDVLLRTACLTALCALRKRQPVRSRYITPFLLQSSFIIYSCTNSFAHWTYFLSQARVIQWSSTYDIIGSSLFDVTYIANSASNAAYSMHVIRYFALINRSVLQKRSGAKHSKAYFRLLRLLMSKALYWTAVMIPVVIVTITSIVTVGLIRCRCVSSGFRRCVLSFV
jgi:hypothetical protein